MIPYNVETFSRDFTYQGSCQCSDVPLTVDYLDIGNSKLELLKITSAIGDYISIKNRNREICGIVNGIEPKDGKVVITHQPISKIFDYDVQIDRSILNTQTLENWMADIIRNTYIDNADTMQNITGLIVETYSVTENAMLGLETNIVNLYKDIIVPAFINYGVVVTFTINPQKKNIICTIKSSAAGAITIESELENIIDRNIVIKESEETLNKLILVNEDNESEKAVYYRLSDNSITTNALAEGRITPVVFDTVYISASGTETFADKAYDKAFSTLKAEEYNNLIELTVIDTDDLIKPYELEVGQTVEVIYKDNIYSSILTGAEYKDEKVKLIFGAIRQQLTKKLKRRLR